MTDSSTAVVRKFNRTVLRRIGSLHDYYVGRERRQHGESRLMWEIGPDGCDVRTLRARLELDSGYVSRLLRALEAAGLITVGPNPKDGRVRVARLTEAGFAEIALLDRFSEALAQTILAPLTEAQQERLVTAMSEVERLLSAGMVEISEVDPVGELARRCLRGYVAEMTARLGERPQVYLDPPASMRPPVGLLLVATLRDEPVGCAALIHRPEGATEVTRLWVAEGFRGMGIGHRLMVELEVRAAARGSSVIRLGLEDTLVEAVTLYRSSGYSEVDVADDRREHHHWFEKVLPTDSLSPA